MKLQETMVERVKGSGDGLKRSRHLDSDVAVSNMERRIEAALGHFRGDFEGEISRKNLGPRFGSYGTFLPVSIRLPNGLYVPEPASSVQRSRQVPELDMNMKKHKSQRCGADYSIAGCAAPTATN